MYGVRREVWWLVWCACLLLLDGTAGSTGSTYCRAQESVPRYKGGATCTFCHSRSLTDNVRPFYRDLVLLNEGTIVRDLDKHALAYKVLEGPLGQAMGRRLGWKVTEDSRCLSCHANQRADVPPAADFAVVKQEGVGCEACHGPGSLYEIMHQQPTWRTKSPQEKYALGMVDVRNPAERVKQCASCHVGSVEQGKVITHEMYAAGHPPLPPFEIGAFVEQMPRHWRYLCEKGAFQHEEKFLEVNRWSTQTARQQLPVLRDILLGDVVVAATALRLEGQLAAASSGNPLDIALFDCQACHHDLRYPAWRQQRTAERTVPGRPLPPEASLALLSALIESLDLADDQRRQWQEQLVERIERRHHAFTVTPFGKPQAVADVSREFAQWLEQELLPLMQKVDCNPQQSRRTLSAVLGRADRTEDYSATRVLVWVAWAVAGELAGGYPDAFRAPEPLAENEGERQARVDGDVQRWQEWQAEASRRRDGLRQKTFDETGVTSALALLLPAGQRVALTEKLPDLLGTMASYEPQEVRSRIRQLQQRLSENFSVAEQ